MSNVSSQIKTNPNDQGQALSAPALFWLYALALAAAELLVATSQPLTALLIHATLVLALVYQSALGGVERGRSLALALLLVPLLRIAALALPPTAWPLLSYTLAGGGIVVATLLVIRALRLRPPDVGLTVGKLWMQLMVMGCGVALGYVGAVLLRPELPAGVASWQALAALALALLVFAGFAEELIFRGLLQKVSGPVLGRWGPLYVATIFAAVQLGFGSPLYALLAFIIGLVFAGVVRLSGSIVGVALAHGVASIVMLLVMPYVRSNPDSLAAAALPLAMVIGGACAALAVVLFALARVAMRQPTRAAGVGKIPSPAPTLSATQLTRLRRDARLTYVALALRVGLPARLIAEIELGLAPFDPEIALRIADGLGMPPQAFLAQT
jgi:membrane protease YdiL (CAAX protease family)